MVTCDQKFKNTNSFSVIEKVFHRKNNMQIMKDIFVYIHRDFSRATCIIMVYSGIEIMQFQIAINIDFCIKINVVLFTFVYISISITSMADKNTESMALL